MLALKGIRSLSGKQRREVIPFREAGRNEGSERLRQKVKFCVAGALAGGTEGRLFEITA